MEFKRVDRQCRQAVNAFIAERWGGTDMVLRGQAVDLSAVDGIVAVQEHVIAGLITFRIMGNVFEITSLDSLTENRGTGTALIEKAVSTAKEMGCGKIVLITTNDNIRALRFYQKRGFDMARLYRNALEESRKIKPQIPLVGDGGIPLRHEIEFEMSLDL